MTILKRSTPFVVLLLLTSQTSLAEVIDVNLNDEAVRATYVAQLEDKGLEADFSFLHHEDDGDVAAAGLQVVDFAGKGSDAWSVGLGGRVFFFDTDADEGWAVGLGGHTAYRWERFEFVGYLFFAPDAVSFGDAEDYFEAGLTAGFRALERGKVYVGVRRVRADFDGSPSVTIDSGLHAGLRISF